MYARNSFAFISILKVVHIYMYMYKHAVIIAVDSLSDIFLK